ncbi:MAG: hypothetical protein JWO45_1961 [Spartobacteria bacterium]|nr:hypothetical protein [Spartobacteria bacterium]
MLQAFFSATGEVDCGARFEFTYTNLIPPRIVKAAPLDGNPQELEAFDPDLFIEQIADPFRISPTDHVYLNANFDFGNDLRAWIRAYITQRFDVHVEFFNVLPEGLSGLGDKVLPEQYAAFYNGQPIWRQSALSSNMGVGERGLRSSLTIKLHDTLHSWLPIAEIMAKHAMQIDGIHEGSKFYGKSKAEHTELAKEVLGRALGRRTGNSRDFNPGRSNSVKQNRAGQDDRFNISALHHNVKRLRLDDASYRYNSAEKAGYFQQLFPARRTDVSGQMKKELVTFENNTRMYEERFDATALVEWAAYILIFLRLALAASMEVDKKRAEYREKLRAALNEDDRLNVVNQFLIEQVSGLQATDEKDVKVRISLDKLLDLQGAALVAFAADIDPLGISPLLDHCIRSDETEQPLAPGLFVAAQILGRLFCNRYLVLDPYHACILADYANPKKLPKDLPAEHEEAWMTAVKLITSFMTENGLVTLLNGAMAAVADGKARAVYVSQSPQSYQPESGGDRRQKNASLSFLAGLNNGEPEILAPPIFVEAGRLILPGDYANEWFEKCNPFEADDLRTNEDR